MCGQTKKHKAFPVHGVVVGWGLLWLLNCLMARILSGATLSIYATNLSVMVDADIF